MFTPKVSYTYLLTESRELMQNVDDNSTGGGSIEFVGSWSSFGGFPSGHIVINTMERGAFVVKVQNALP
jgi:hypothetical protein